MEAVLPLVEKFAAWAQKNPQTFMIIAGALGAIAASIMAINVAMALNPISAIAIGIIALVAGLAIAYKRFESVRTVVDFLFNALKIGISQAISNFRTMLDIVKAVFNGIGSAWNNTFGKISFSIPNIPGIPGRGTKVQFPKIPALADGGIIRHSPGGTLALIGEGGRDEAVIPLDRMGSMGGNNVTINVNGGDPQSVVNALRTYMRQNGSVPIRVSNIF
jgi:hypothetical protein